MRYNLALDRRLPAHQTPLQRLKHGIEGQADDGDPENAELTFLKTRAYFAIHKLRPPGGFFSPFLCSTSSGRTTVRMLCGPIEPQRALERH
jgi:hypothetical protein